MKKVFLISIAVSVSAGAFSQKAENKRKSYYIGAQYNQEFVLDGYVRVREWDLQGDKLKLKNLGMRSYPALQLYVEKNLRRNRSISLTYDQYFMRGSAIFDRNITYNGTIINGRNGIDVSPTRYFRVSAAYKGNLLDKPHLDLKYTIALVLDHITFYLDGEVSPSSPGNEVYEGFGRQALPYPVLGLQGKLDLAHKNKLNFELSGTYIPRFESFYTEGGHVDLQYGNFLAGLSYSRIISDFELSLGIKLRYLHLFQESREDTNIITSLTAGPYIGIVYNF